jgi:antagonist of KipI
MADSQTTGGYPRLAHVSSTSRTTLAQLNPNGAIRFRFISLQEAEDGLIRQKRYLKQIRNICKLKIENFLHAFM